MRLEFLFLQLTLFNMSTNIEAGTDDEAHEEAQRETGFWGLKGAGVLPFCSSTKRFLLGMRSGHVEEPLTWGTFGGAIDQGEDVKSAALREFTEESGYRGKCDLRSLFVFKSGKFAFHNFLAIVPKEFKPKLDKENSAAKWCTWNDFPNPQHFGLVALLQDKMSRDLIQKEVDR